jgi:hypothetical protein
MGIRIWTDQTFLWVYSRFWDGRELVEDDERSGRPKSTGTEVNIAAVADLVKNGRWIAPRMIAEYFNLPKTLLPRILKEDLVKRRCFLVARYCASQQSCRYSQIFDPQIYYNPLSPPVLSRFIGARLFSFPQVRKWSKKISTLRMLLRSKKP